MRATLTLRLGTSVGPKCRHIQEKISIVHAVRAVSCNMFRIDRTGQVNGQGIEIVAQIGDEDIAHLEHALEFSAEIFERNVEG